MELSVTANLNQPVLLKTVVETLASRHVDLGYANSAVPAAWKAVETSSIPAYVLGTFNMKNNPQEHIHLPFASCFLFTCIRGAYGLYNLEWSASLS